MCLKINYRIDDDKKNFYCTDTIMSHDSISRVYPPDKTNFYIVFQDSEYKLLDMMLYFNNESIETFKREIFYNKFFGEFDLTKVGSELRLFHLIYEQVFSYMFNSTIEDKLRANITSEIIKEYNDTISTFLKDNFIKYEKDNFLCNNPIETSRLFNLTFFNKKMPNEKNKKCKF